MNYPKVYIILVNYNGWLDAIECLESVFKLNYGNFQVIIVDNNSENNSLEKIKSYLDGSLNLELKVNPELKHLVYPLSKKPLPYVYYNRDEAEKGGNLELEKKLKNPVILIQSGYNGGFAFGNNVGIKYSMAKNDFEYIWLLNNDTVVEKDSLSKLVEKGESYKKQNKKIGIIGSKLLYYDKPKILNSVGAKYNKWFGVSKHIGFLEKDLGQYDNENTTREIDYVSGASMFIKKSFIDDIGLMCEDYFLYYEELDWIGRGRKKEWEIGYCWESKIYHKEGSTIGGNTKEPQRNKVALYYFFRNKIRFTRRIYPKYLFFIYLRFLITIINKIIRCEFEMMKLIKDAIKNA
jgi:GT2 family glycosyltransferase